MRNIPKDFIYFNVDDTIINRDNHRLNGSSYHNNIHYNIQSFNRNTYYVNNERNNKDFFNDFLRALERNEEEDFRFLNISRRTFMEQPNGYNIDFLSNEIYRTDINLDQTRTTQTIEPTNVESSKKSLFDIKKPKKRGKHTKEHSCRNNNPLVHNKYQRDNIVMKIKVNVSNNYRAHLNLILEKSENVQFNSIRLKKIDPSLIKVDSRDDNMALLKKTMKDIFSGKLSKKYKNLDCDYNKKRIDLIMKIGDEEIKNALNKNFKDSLDIYCCKKTDIHLFDDFKTIENDITKFKEKGEEEEYIKTYKKYAMDFENTIKAIHRREPRKKY